MTAGSAGDTESSGPSGRKGPFWRSGAGLALGLALLGALGWGAWALSWPRLQLNHALYLVLENRPGEAKALLRRLADEGGDPRAEVFLKELALCGWPAPEALAAAEPSADAPELLRTLAAYLRGEGDFAPRGFVEGSTPAEILAGGKAEPVASAGLFLLEPEAPLLAEALSLRRARRWADLHGLLSESAPEWGQSPARSIFELLWTRARFETAHWDGLEESIARQALARTLHRDLVGPAMYVFRETGRHGEAMLLLDRFGADGRRFDLRSLFPFTWGPSAFRPALLETSKSLPENPADVFRAAPRPRGYSSASGGAFPWPRTGPPIDGALPLRMLARAEAGAGIIIADPADPKKTRYTFASAGELRFVFDEPLPIGSGRLVVEGFGEAADNEWPILLLRVNGKALSEIRLDSSEAANYYRSFRLPGGEPLRSVSLTYTNNQTTGAGDRNAFALEIWLAPGSP